MPNLSSTGKTGVTPVGRKRAEKRYLTDRTLKALPPAKQGKRYDLWDTKVPGFGCRVGDDTDPSRPGKAGHISFVLYARFPGSPHPSRRALGRYSAITLEAAREKAAEWRELARKGIDPAAVEEEARQAALRKQDETFSAVAEKFIDHIKAKKEHKAAEVERDLRREFIAVGGRPIASITAAMSRRYRRDAPARQTRTSATCSVYPQTFPVGGPASQSTRHAAQPERMIAIG
jgi:hypothetical protein